MKTASRLIEQLEQAGYTVHIEGEDLSLKWTRSGDPSLEHVKILREVKAHKTEVINYLRLLQTLQSKLERPIVVKSGYLKDTFCLVASEGQAREIEKAGGVCYLPAEVGVLLTNSTGMDEETLTNYLNKIHMLKKTFPGARVGRG